MSRRIRSATSCERLLSHSAARTRPHFATSSSNETVTFRFFTNSVYHDLRAPEPWLALPTLATRSIRPEAPHMALEIPADVVPAPVVFVHRRHDDLRPRSLRAVVMRVG